MNILDLNQNNVILDKENNTLLVHIADKEILSEVINKTCNMSKDKLVKRIEKFGIIGPYHFTRPCRGFILYSSPDWCTLEQIINKINFIVNKGTPKNENS